MVIALGVMGAVTGASMPARKQPDAAFRRNRCQCYGVRPANLDRATHPDLAPLPPRTNHHALTVDVVDFQTREFGTPKSRGVEAISSVRCAAAEPHR